MKKYFAPVIITIITVILIGLYCLLYVFIFSEANFPVWISVITAVVFLLLIIAMIVVFMKRVRELKEENEDDYRKY